MNSIDAVNKIIRLSKRLGIQVPDMYHFNDLTLKLYIGWLEKEIEDKG